jgi:transcriptional regulator with XRE-family HTH domain
MARIMGVSLVTYKRWETNVFSPDYGTLGIMAAYFGVSVDNLLGRPTPSQLTPADRENLAATAEAIADILAKTEVSHCENGDENGQQKRLTNSLIQPNYPPATSPATFYTMYRLLNVWCRFAFREIPLLCNVL